MYASDGMHKSLDREVAADQTRTTTSGRRHSEGYLKAMHMALLLYGLQADTLREQKWTHYTEAG